MLVAEVAVDLMAETFAQAYRDRGQFRGSGDVDARAWVFGIARNCAANYVRRGIIERRALERLGVAPRELTDCEIERIEELADFGDLGDRVLDDLGRLDPDQQEALRLRVVDERPYDEVARVLGVTEDAARARVSRGLRALRRMQITDEQAGERVHHLR